MMSDFGMGMGSGFGWIFWLLIIAGIVFLFRGGFLGCGMGQRGNGSRNSDDSPLNILKQRYAKGEISKDEYERMKKELL